MECKSITLCRKLTLHKPEGIHGEAGLLLGGWIQLKRVGIRNWR
jgi:hypothetical protein